MYILFDEVRGISLKQIHVILTGILLTSSIGLAESLETSPINPAFETWQVKQNFSNLQSNTVTNMMTKDYKTGFIPPIIPPIIHQSLPDFLQPLGGPPPIKYDMRDPNNDGDTSDSLLTPIKDQVYSGPCWAFATYASLDGSFKKFFGWEKDFSEDHLTHSHGYDWDPTDGGNYFLSMAYLARNGGPINETDDPYDTYDVNGNYQSNTSTPCSTCNSDRYVDNTIMLPVRNAYDDLDYIKNALLTHGPLFTSMQVTGASYDAASYSFYYEDADTSDREIDHGVTIVGWDDNYEMTHNGSTVTGAFIIKNSWGNWWGGENGYNYVAYEDDSIAFVSLGYFDDRPESELMFDEIYQYDPLGIVSAVGYGDSDDYGANVFTAQQNEDLMAVGIGVYDNSNIEITIYGTVSGSNFSNPLTTKTVTGLDRGYYTIALDSPVSLTAGTKFAVAVRYTDNTGSNSYVIPMENRYAGYSSAATAAAGQSYISSSGSSWTDLTSYYANANVTIKAFISRAACRESKLLTANQWHMVSMACDPGTKTVADLFPEFNPADYSTTWELFDRDAVTEQYNTIGVNTILSSNGKGYWFFTDKADVTLAVDGNKNSGDDIPLVSGSEGRMNLLGHPHIEEVEWKDVLIVDGEDTYSLADANTAGMMSNKMYQWESGAYQVYDGETPGLEGTLSAFDGFWTEVFDSDLSLRIPTPVAAAAASSRLSSLSMAPETILSAPITKRSANNNKKVKKNKNKDEEKTNDWFVRLIVESGSLRDPGNVLGQLSDSEDGQDKHDLKEKEPFSSPYLSVVFPHTDWEDSGWGYTSDFHAVNKTKKGRWKFTVKASENVSKATLHWEGSEEILKKAILIDKETGKRIKLKKTKSYTFDIINGEHEFIFKTKKQSRRSRFFDR